MEERIHSYTAKVTSSAGVEYSAHAYGAPNESRTWDGWLVFRPVTGGADLRTSRETTQPDRGALEYWATGLEPVYLEGALERAERS